MISRLLKLREAVKYFDLRYPLFNIFTHFYWHFLTYYTFRPFCQWHTLDEPGTGRLAIFCHRIPGKYFSVLQSCSPSLQWLRVASQQVLEEHQEYFPHCVSIQCGAIDTSRFLPLLAFRARVHASHLSQKFACCIDLAGSVFRSSPSALRRSLRRSGV